jgi:hypothetical protein
MGDQEVAQELSSLPELQVVDQCLYLQAQQFYK